MCGAEELQDDMSLKQVYLMNWSPRVSKKKKDIIILKKQILHVYSLLNYIIVLVQCFLVHVFIYHNLEKLFPNINDFEKSSTFSIDLISQHHE